MMSLDPDPMAAPRSLRACREKNPAKADITLRSADSTGKRVLGGLVVLPLLLVSVPGLGDDPVEKGEAVALEWDSRDRGFGDSRVELTMTLEDRKGATRTRRLRIDTLERAGDDEGDWSLAVFEEPRDVKGTALLSYANILEPDDQWLYLPALKRVKRISATNRSGPFVGSEFAYEDLTAQEVRKYDYLWMRDERCGPTTCFVVERRPRYENSGYTRLLTWYDQEEYQVRRVEYYDRNDVFLKTLSVSDYRQYLDRFWRAHGLVMDNHKTGKRTRLDFGDYQFQLGLTERDFDKNALKRVR